MFLKNCWYVAAESAEVSRQPFGRLLLNEPVVMYRREDGQPVALEDRCCHRRAPLSRGKVEGDNLRCGYHGFLYDADGKCVWVPGTDRIPSAAKVRSYPVHEKHKWIWIWMGEAALADPALIPDFHHNDTPGWASTGTCLPVKASYLYLVENLLDLSHVAFLHVNTIGSASDTNPNLDWERTETFVRGTRVANNIPPTPRNRASGITCNLDVTKVMTFLPPCHVSIEITQHEAGKSARDSSVSMHSMILNSMTPETETTCHYFWASARDFDINNAELTRFILDITTRAFQEDQGMLEGQQQIIDLDPSKPIVSVIGDAGAVAATRMVERLIAEERQPARAAQAA
jgi:vanillate O-demethylase monooxygenase subunit